ncbi:ABC transporter, ATP-binding protein [Mycoavidus cysteinexigens]|uniref:ABC transporter, ATP-binding protein n=1 Tax=Mycoavidus cysteinexigens TaxID=1553431 RepID=A0A2Z6EUJ5_9BURK|nr:ABC transporter, ATP-binding protein [Mycoavidus cysteinexigens]
MAIVIARPMPSVRSLHFGTLDTKGRIAECPTQNHGKQPFNIIYIDVGDDSKFYCECDATLVFSRFNRMAPSAFA